MEQAHNYITDQSVRELLKMHVRGMESEGVRQRMACRYTAVLQLPLWLPDQPKTHKVTSEIGRVTKAAGRPAVSRFAQPGPATGHTSPS